MNRTVQRVPQQTEEALEMEELDRTIKGLKRGKAAGADDIPNKKSRPAG